MAVWCDMETDGGGWTVFLNRAQQTQQLNFSKTWEAYADGFGDPSAEYWLGELFGVFYVCVSFVFFIDFFLSQGIVLAQL